jgi:phosphoribosylformylglycinamidine cyclo-ligase
VTGGGLAANLARVLPRGSFARVDRSTWTPPAVFQVVRELGRVPVPDLERTLNLGIGFVAVVPADQADAVVRQAAARNLPAWVLGDVSERATATVEDGLEVVQGAKGVDGGSVQVVGTHPAA